VEKLTYAYDQLMRKASTTINTTAPFTTSYKYRTIGVYNDATTQIEKITYSNGKALSYTYDSNGNILTVKDQNNTIIYSYEYDSLGQLVRENDSVEQLTRVYTYYNGNINYVDLYSFTTGELGERLHRFTYDYWSSDWNDLLTCYGDLIFSYDTIGNPLNWRDNMQFTWSEGRRLATISNRAITANYTYNQDGIRTSKTVNGVRTDYYLNGTTIVMQKTGDNCIWFTYDENGLVTGFRYNDQEYYYYKNLQGDIIGIVDSAGSVVAEYYYSAWGTLTYVSDANGIFIDDPNHIANINPFRYRGYYYDNESGLYYLNSRYYDSVVCRFLNADDESTLTATPNATTDKNLFTYCDNNPVMRADNGGEFWHIAVGAALGGLLSGITQVASNLIAGNNWYDGLGVSILTGMASGALAATGVGLVGSIAGNAAISMAGNAANQVIKNNGFDNFDVVDMVVDGAIGAASGAVGGRGMGKSANIKTLNKRLTKKVLTGSKETIKKGVKYYVSQTKYAYKEFLVKPILKSSIASATQHTVKSAGGRYTK